MYSMFMFVNMITTKFTEGFEKENNDTFMS